jgi:hypothetical protein
MWIIGCDFHPSRQQVAWLDTETGETGERKLVNGDGEAALLSQLACAGVSRSGSLRQQSVVCGAVTRPLC